MALLRYQPWARPRLAIARAHEIFLKLDPEGSRLGPFPIDMNAVGRIVGMDFILSAEVARFDGRGALEEAVCMQQGDVTVALIPSTDLPGRIIFNGAHEAGHKACGHFDNFDIPWLRAHAKTSRAAALTLGALDREADIFATELLMPLAVVRYLDLTVEELEYHHCVSRSAALGRREDLEDPDWLEYTYHDEKLILAHCSEYINDILALRAMRS